LNRLLIVALTHKTLGIKGLNQVAIDDSKLPALLTQIKHELNLSGLMYLSTCNRMEFILSCPHEIKETDSAGKRILKIIHPEFIGSVLEKVVKGTKIYKGEAAVKHLFNVASSLDSMIVGEREIITQVRNAYEWSLQKGLTDDLIRILIHNAIGAAKNVYTHSKIAEKPVSVMSLACRKMREWNVKEDSRVLVIGAGQTADTMIKYLSKHNFTQFTVFNRTVKNMEALAEKYKIDARPLSELDNYKGGFDILITCITSHKPIITESIFKTLCNGDTRTKIVIDMGIPFNVDKSVYKLKDVKSVTLEDLNKMSKENLNERKEHIKSARAIILKSLKEFSNDLHNRKVEIAMRDVPEQIQKLKQLVYTKVFNKEIEALPAESKEVLNKVVNYFEKKYIGIPMQLAKEIMKNSIPVQTPPVS
jgi:glutamyl-tRNA reductase